MHVPFRYLFSATQIGFLFNILIPARLGEFVRAYVLTRLAKLELPKSLALVALDRTTDLIGVIVMVLVALTVFPTDRPIIVPADFFHTAQPLIISPNLLKFVVALLVLALLVILALFYVLCRYQDAAKSFLDDRLGRLLPGPLNRRIIDSLSNFANGLHVLRSGRDMVSAICLSLVTWVLSISCIGFVILAFGIRCPWYTPLVIEVIAIAFTIAPITPAMIGQFHLAVATGFIISAPGADLSTVKALTLLTHAMALLPVMLAGTYCLLRERIGLFAITEAGFAR